MLASPAICQRPSPFSTQTAILTGADAKRSIRPEKVPVSRRNRMLLSPERPARNNSPGIAWRLQAREGRTSSGSTR